MWTADSEIMDGGRLCRMRLRRDGQPVCYADVLARWQDDQDFRHVFIRLLAEAPYDAYLWETPPITRATVERDFECMLVDSPTLAGLGLDSRAFAPHFDTAGSDTEVVAFPNLGGDAFLVAPTPRGDPGAYPHLAVFARRAPAGQQHAFWRRVGAEAAAHLGESPLWLSTCGLGVAWLHARLDTWPKYYTYRPYRTAV